MAANRNSGLGNGTNGHPQGGIEEGLYPSQVETVEIVEIPPRYNPSPKHDPRSGRGSENPIKSNGEGQHLLDTGYRDGRQIYNVTSDGKLVKFQPDGSPDNGYHSYEVLGTPDVPPAILRQMVRDGRISRSDYKKFLKGGR